MSTFADALDHETEQANFLATLILENPAKDGRVFQPDLFVTDYGIFSTPSLDALVELLKTRFERADVMDMEVRSPELEERDWFAGGPDPDQAVHAVQVRAKGGDPALVFKPEDYGSVIYQRYGDILLRSWGGDQALVSPRPDQFLMQHDCLRNWLAKFTRPYSGPVSEWDTPRPVHRMILDWGIFFGAEDDILEVLKTRFQVPEPELMHADPETVSWFQGYPDPGWQYEAMEQATARGEDTYMTAADWKEPMHYYYGRVVFRPWGDNTVNLPPSAPSPADP